MNEETKKCPFCIQDISALATKCPYCQSKVPVPTAKSFRLHRRSKGDSRNLILTAFAVAVGSFLVIGVFAAANSKNVNQKPDMNVQVYPAQSKKLTAPGNEKITYTKKAISSLVSDSSTGILVEVEGKILKNTVVTYKSLVNEKEYVKYYLKLGAGNGVLLVMSDNDIFDRFSIGDTVNVKGPLGRLGYGVCGINQQDGQMTNLCRDAGIENQSNTPIIVLQSATSVTPLR